jgi:MFS family permease
VSPRQLGVLTPLEHRDFRHLAAGSLVSLLGDGVFRVTIAVQVLTIRNDPRALSLVAASWALSQFLTLPMGGWAADRYERRSLMVVADCLRMAALGILAALSLTDTLLIWHLSALGMVVGVGNGLFNPAAMSFVPDLLPSEELERANSFLGVARPLMLWILGPLIGAMVVAAGGPGTALGLNSVSFGISALFLLGITRRPVAHGTAGRAGWRATVADVAEGLRFVRQRRWAWAWIAAAGVSTMVHSGAFEVLLPTLLLNEFDLTESGVAGALAGAFAVGGAGSMVASTLLGQRGIPRRFVTLLFVFEGGALAAVVAYGLITATWQPALIGGVIFTLFALTDIIGTTLIQKLVPRRMLGRVSSVDWMTSIGLAPVGYVVAGPLGHIVGARQAIVLLGAFGAAIVLGLVFVPGVREPETRGPLRGLRADDDVPVPGAPRGSIPIVDSPTAGAPLPREDGTTS